MADEARRGSGPASITVAVLARDEADFIEGCLASVGWADELLVLVDAATRDSTVETARRFTERVEVRPFAGFPRQRNLALDLAGGRWVLFVDADERVPPALAAEIRRTLAKGSEAVGFWIPRRNLICGRWVRTAGWWPDCQLRLLRRGAARYDEAEHVHEVARLDGPAGRLLEPLLHLNYETLGEFRQKQGRYARLEARALYGGGVKARRRSLLGQPARELWRRFVELGGYRQGWLGLELSLLMAEAKYRTYRELQSVQSLSGRSDGWR